jgi:hypothetical protein
VVYAASTFQGWRAVTTYQLAFIRTCVCTVLLLAALGPRTCCCTVWVLLLLLVLFQVQLLGRAAKCTAYGLLVVLLVVWPSLLLCKSSVQLLLGLSSPNMPHGPA